MFIVVVQVHVKPDAVAPFKEAAAENARASLLEPGVARFDVIQEAKDPTRFALIEVYRDQAASAQHKQTAHYVKWRDAVAELMAAPRTSVIYENVFPGENGWASAAQAAR